MSTTNLIPDVTLRAWPAPKNEALNPQDLLAQVSQLATERGHLREITEQSLQDEIEASKHELSILTEENEEREKDKPEEQSTKDKLEEIHVARIEMLKKLECVECYAIYELRS
jgi:mediator of RNA polymerase II transcription subunit 17, fungi type